MTTSFRAKYPASTIKNIKVFSPGTVSPTDWTKQQLSGLKVGDIVVCFNPFSTEDGANAQLEPSALMLVFNVDQNGPMGMLLTDEFYATGPAESIIRERAVAAASRNTNFSFVKVPFIGAITEEGNKFVTGMQRWGSGPRANPVHGLPDPLVVFFACMGAPLPAVPPVNIDTMAQALIKGNFVPPVTDLSTKYSVAVQQAAERTPAPIPMTDHAPAIGSNPTPPSGSPSITSVTMIEETPPAATPAGTPPAAVPASSTPVATPVNPAPVVTPVNPTPVVQSDITGTQSPGSTFRNQSTVPSGGGAPSVPTGNLPATGSAETTTIKDLDKSLTEAASTSDGASAPPSAAASSENGFLSIRKRLEARLSGRLPKSSPSADAATPRAEPTSPALKLVSNIRQQMSIASDNLEYRVSTLKSKMLDRLVSCKHNLSEKEQLSLKALEDLRAKMQNKLEYAAARAKEELGKTASEGTAQVRVFQSKAPGQLAEMISLQEQALHKSTEEAKQKVTDAIAATRDELNKTVSRAQHTLRGHVTTTEVNLNQIVNQCAESMDERIEGFRLQTNILGEGIGLSVESLGEAAKLQAQQSEDEVIKRLEALSEESLKSLREQSVKAEMECSKLIDKLSREKLMPTLQDKRRVVVDLAGFFHDEFTAAMQDLLENRLAEFDPVVRATADANGTYLQEFRSRWTVNLEQHQRDLDESEVKLRITVDEYLAESKTHIESMQDVTKITDYVLTSPELIRSRDETCLRFDILAREHVAKAFNQAGDQVNISKQECLDELTEIRQRAETMLKDRGEQSRARIRASIKSAMQKIQDLQSKYTA